MRRRVVVEAVEAWLGRDTLPASWSVVVSVEGERAHFTIFERGKLVAVRRFDDLPDCRDFEAALGASIGLSLEALLTRRAEVEQERAEGEPSTTESEGPRERQGSPLASTLHGTFAPTTLTSPACMAGPIIAEEARLAVEKLEGVESAEVRIVWEPRWTEDRMSEELKLMRKYGMFR